MKLPLRARIIAWYFAVLVVSFASFAWISDLGFQHSIETTVNDASGANLESIQRVLARTAPKGDAKVKEELNELGGVWEGAPLLEVSDSDGTIIFQSKPFKKPFGTVPHGFTLNLDRLQYRIATGSTEVNGKTFRIRAAVPDPAAPTATTSLLSRFSRRSTKPTPMWWAAAMTTITSASPRKRLMALPIPRVAFANSSLAPVTRITAPSAPRSPTANCAMRQPLAS